MSRLSKEQYVSNLVDELENLESHWWEDQHARDKLQRELDSINCRMENNQRKVDELKELYHHLTGEEYIG